jgi:hypothetical protein
MTSARVSFLALSLLASLTACRKAVVESYRVPKEANAEAAKSDAANANPTAPAAPTAAAASGSTPATSGATMAATPVTTAAGAGLTWNAPSHWVAQAVSSMRKGSYIVKSAGVAGQADLSITAFPGDVGGDLANLNRWRGQLQLPPIAAADLAGALQRSEHNGLTLKVADLVGTGANAERILGAIVPYGGDTWFFKLKGPDALVAKEKAAFTAFLDTIQPAPAAK